MGITEAISEMRSLGEGGGEVNDENRYFNDLDISYNYAVTGYLYNEKYF
jgi:hypothetical protein